MLKIDPHIRTKIVELRKARTTILTISENTGISTPYVSNILKEELGDQYDNYKLRNTGRVFSEQQKKGVVTLRKNGFFLEAIKDITNIPVRSIRDILKEKLGDEYLKYQHGNHCQKYIEGWREEEVAEILKLRESGKSLKEIRRLTGSSDVFIKRVLIQKGNENLMPDSFSHVKPLTKEQIISKFKEWYYVFAREVKVGSPSTLGSLQSEAIETFLGVLEGLPQPSHKIDMLMTVFMYSFFRTKGFNVTFSLLKRLSGLTKHECFHMLKKINGTFPEYITRDRKRIILDNIRDVESFFQLNSRFFENAGKILQKLWGILSNTTDGVIVGTVSALALISIHNSSPLLCSVCQKLEITQSAVIYQIKKVVNRLGVSGFTTLGKSKDLVCSEVLRKVVGI